MEVFYSDDLNWVNWNIAVHVNGLSDTPILKSGALPQNKLYMMLILNGKFDLQVDI